MRFNLDTINLLSTFVLSKSTPEWVFSIHLSGYVIWLKIYFCCSCDPSLFNFEIDNLNVTAVADSSEITTLNSEVLLFDKVESIQATISKYHRNFFTSDVQLPLN